MQRNHKKTFMRLLEHIGFIFLIIFSIHFLKINAEDCSHDGSLSVENVLWANTVLASGTAIGLVVYTGRETRSVMNTTLPDSKVGLIDREVLLFLKIFIFK